MVRSSLDGNVAQLDVDHGFDEWLGAARVSNAIYMTTPAAHGLRTLATGEAFEACRQLGVALA